MKHQRLLNIALTSLLIGYALLGSTLRYEADDYCHALEIVQAGPVGFTVSQYINWQGRYTSTLLLALLHDAFGSRAPALVPTLLIVGIVGGWYYLLLRIRRAYALTLALALTLGLITGVPNLWQFFWMASALNYALSLVGVLFLFGWLARRLPLAADSPLPDLANSGT